jgi:hypothetical protein
MLITSCMGATVRITGAQGSTYQQQHYRGAILELVSPGELLRRRVS